MLRSKTICRRVRRREVVRLLAERRTRTRAEFVVAGRGSPLLATDRNALMGAWRPAGKLSRRTANGALPGAWFAAVQDAPVYITVTEWFR